MQLLFKQIYENYAEGNLLGLTTQMPQAANIALISTQFLYYPVFLDVPDHILSLFTCIVNSFSARRIDGTYRFAEIFIVGHLSGKFLRK
jgi:hypothetical protein